VGLGGLQYYAAGGPQLFPISPEKPPFVIAEECCRWSGALPNPLISGRDEHDSNETEVRKRYRVAERRELVTNCCCQLPALLFPYFADEDPDTSARRDRSHHHYRIAANIDIEDDFLNVGEDLVKVITHARPTERQ